MTSTRHDELVEEIYESLLKFGAFLLKYRREGDRHAEHEMTMATAANLIAYIGEAYADGMPLPGEVGRWNLGSIYDEPEGTWFKEWLNEMLFKKDAFEFIALSPTGTGEEE